MKSSNYTSKKLWENMLGVMINRDRIKESSE